MASDEIPLLGGRVTTGIVRVADTVRRPISGDRTAVHALLRHLESVGFDGTPRFLGIDEIGREILSFLPGEVPADLGHYDDAALQAAAALLRRFHDATSGFSAVTASGAEVICHNDWGPPNAVFRDGVPVALIDFDTIRPGLRLWDLGYSAGSWLDLGSDDYSPEEQLRRLTLFAAAYNHPACTPAQIAAYALARRSALAAAGRARANPALADPALADWAEQTARWIATNLTERLLPTGMMPPAQDR